MKTSLVILISTAAALAALSAGAATHEQSAASPAQTTSSAKPAEDVSTSGRNWTAQDAEDLIPPQSLQRQGVVTWGAATQPGPRNEHVFVERHSFLLPLWEAAPAPAEDPEQTTVPACGERTERPFLESNRDRTAFQESARRYA